MIASVSSAIRGVQSRKLKVGHARLKPSMGRLHTGLGTLQGIPLDDGPPNCVRKHLPNRRMVVYGVSFVTRREKKDPPSSTVEAATTAKDLASRKRADEDEFIGCRDVKKLAVHLVRLDDEWARNPLGDRVTREKGPNNLSIVAVSPSHSAAGPHEAAEDLREVRRVENEQAHALEHAPIYPVYYFIGDLFMGSMSPPQEDVGSGQALGG